MPPKATAPSKAQAVRDALAEGIESIGAIDAFLKSRYRIVMPRQMISAYKGMEKKRAAGTLERKPVRRDPSRAYGQSDLLDVLTALKPLVAKHGADRIKQLADLLK